MDLGDGGGDGREASIDIKSQGQRGGTFRLCPEHRSPSYQGQTGGSRGVRNVRPDLGEAGCNQPGRLQPRIFCRVRRQKPRRA